MLTWSLATAASCWRSRPRRGSAALLYPYVGQGGRARTTIRGSTTSTSASREARARTDRAVLPADREDCWRCPPPPAVMADISLGSANITVKLPPSRSATSRSRIVIAQRARCSGSIRRPDQRLRRNRHFRRLDPGRRGSGSGGNRLEPAHQGPEIEKLQGYTVQLMDKIRTIPGSGGRRHQFRADAAGAARQRRSRPCRRLGVHIDSLASSLRTLVGGEEISEYQDGDDQYIVRLRLDEPFRNNPATLGSLLVPAAPGTDGAGQRRGHPDRGSRAGDDRSVQPAAADLDQRQPRSGAAQHGASVSSRCAACTTPFATRRFTSPTINPRR